MGCSKINYLKLPVLLEKEITIDPLPKKWEMSLIALNDLLILKYSSRKRFCLPGKFIVFFKIGPFWPLSPSMKLYVMIEKKK